MAIDRDELTEFLIGRHVGCSASLLRQALTPQPFVVKYLTIVDVPTEQAGTIDLGFASSVRQQVPDTVTVRIPRDKLEEVKAVCPEAEVLGEASATGAIPVTIGASSGAPSPSPAPRPSPGGGNPLGDWGQPVTTMIFPIDKVTLK